MSPEDKRSYMSHPNFWPYIIALLCSILMAYAIARLVSGSETHGLFRGISAGILVGLAAAVAMMTEMVFEARAGSFILISAAYPFLGCILMGIIIGAWKPKGRSRSASHIKAAKPMKIEGKIVPGYLKVLTGLDQLPGPEGERYIELFRHGTLTVELYAPRGNDPQTPHSRDEIYVIISGTGRFQHGSQETSFGPGDILFVPAREEHRFRRVHRRFRHLGIFLRAGRRRGRSHQRVRGARAASAADKQSPSARTKVDWRDDSVE